MKHRILTLITLAIIGSAIALCMSSCAIPVSQAVSNHAMGEQASPVTFGIANAAGRTATPVSAEAEKSKAFWGN